jgi:hypothetical protein
MDWIDGPPLSRQALISLMAWTRMPRLPDSLRSQGKTSLTRQKDDRTDGKRNGVEECRVSMKAFLTPATYCQWTGSLHLGWIRATLP